MRSCWSGSTTASVDAGKRESIAVKRNIGEMTTHIPFYYSRSEMGAHKIGKMTTCHLMRV